MNSIGRYLIVTLSGESHGPGISVVIDSPPPGLQLAEGDFEASLARRRPSSPGTTARVEPDPVVIESGVYCGHTTGAPVLLRVPNREHRSEDYASQPVLPRPGHADFAARSRFQGFADPRGGGIFSGRLTVGLVCAGVVARRMLPGIAIEARVVEIGGTACWDGRLSQVIEAGDSLGGVVECRVRGLVPGLGQPFFDGLDSLLAHMLFAIPGVKGLEFGDGFAAARMLGSEFNDCLLDAQGHSPTNHAGGLSGGLTNANELLLRVAFRPPASISRPQRSYSFAQGRVVDFSLAGRHDSCYALRTPVIVESCVALVLADQLMARRASTPWQ